MIASDRLAHALTATTDAEPTPNTAPRILIVDDIADNRTVLSRRFARRGFQFVEADNGARALELVATQAFDAVLLDVMMPGIDGLEVLRRIRQTTSPVELPVIMVTAKAESEHVVEALKLQANDYVTKPVDFEIALARVNAQIDRKRSAEKVQSAKEALETINNELERRVEERTRSLVEINQQLQGEIEQRELSEAQSRFLAFHDPLTNLPNRRRFREDLAASLARAASGTAGRPAVLFLDLDGFKSVNDTLGHSIGDLLLQSIARDFCAVLQPTDRIARLGGDEFAILQVTDGQPQQAIDLARRLIEIASRERLVHGHQLTVGTSIGVVLASDDRADCEELLKAADLAMYRAKVEGRGTFRIFDPSMVAHIQARRSLELDLRNAQMLGQLKVFYQPQVALRTRRIMGFEALLRWRHPERGMVAPLDFIPLAEEIGLIVPIGDWVLREACREAASWPDPLLVAVNVSSVQFTRGNLVNSVMGALASSGLAPHRLELEVTESVLLKKTERNLETLNQLRNLGVKISMDDFGTGYSSLSYLRLFPFDKLKIDKSFVEDVTSDKDCKAIVNAILGLGESFGIPTTAEGVETEEQLLHLREGGCTAVQGYIFSMPIEGSAVGEFIRRINLPG